MCWSGHLGTTDLQGGPPTSYKYGYKSTYRGYNPSYPIIRPFIRVISPFITSRGPPCTEKMKQLGVSEEQPAGPLCADCQRFSSWTAAHFTSSARCLVSRRTTVFVGPWPSFTSDALLKALLMTSDIMYTNFQGDTHQPSPTIKDHVDLLGRPWKLVKG